MLNKKLLILLLTLVINIIPQNMFIAHAITQNEISYANKEEEALYNALFSYIIPGYKKVLTALITTDSDLKHYCTQANNKKLNQLKNSFKVLIDNWSAIELFQTGPIIENYHLEKMLYFPDKKNRAKRALVKLLKKVEKKIVLPSKVITKSIAFKGLRALETILYSIQSQPKKTPYLNFQCTLAKNMIEEMSVIIDQVIKKWSHKEYQYQWIKIGKENSIFFDKQEAKQFFLATLVKGLDNIADKRIGTFLNSDKKRDHLNDAIYKTSQSTMRSIAMNFKGLSEFFDNSKIHSLLPKNSLYLKNSLQANFNRLEKFSFSLDFPTSEILKNDKKRRKLLYIKSFARTLRDRIDSEFAAALGIDIGTIFGDGD